MSENTPTYILLGIYVLLMIVVTGYANWKNRSDAAEDEAKKITSHFLANKNFGAILLLLTTFASVFSGYTVVGVPNETGVNGFTAVRWVASVCWVGFSFLLIFPRLRRISVIRNYDSPGDFIYDRYHSIWLRLFVTLSLCLPQLFYLAVQLHSLGSTISALTNGELDFYPIIIVSAIMMVLFEILGGLRSVAYTDAVQATFMVIVFIALPIVLAVLYGGFEGQVVNNEDLPCSNHELLTVCEELELVELEEYENDTESESDWSSLTGLNGNVTSTETSLSLFFNNENFTYCDINDDDFNESFVGIEKYIESGCLNYVTRNIADEFYLRMPSTLTIINYLLFSFSLTSFGLNPHVVQRVFSAKEDWQVKFVVIAMFGSPWITMIPVCDFVSIDML